MVSSETFRNRWLHERVTMPDGTRLTALWRLNGFPKEFLRRFRRNLTAWPTCHWCGEDLVPQSATVDHVHALGLGGRDTVDNIVPACKTCNVLRSREQAWMAHCRQAMSRYWYAVDRGADHERASRYAQRPVPLGKEFEAVVVGG